MLDRRQCTVTAGLGVFFWFVFALVVRFGGPLGLFGGGMGALVFLGSVPLAWWLIGAIVRLGRLSEHQVVAGMSLSTGTAALCDGVAMTWTSLYGTDPRLCFLGAAYILWGAGVLLVLAQIRQARALSAHEKRG